MLLLWDRSSNRSVSEGTTLIFVFLAGAEHLFFVPFRWIVARMCNSCLSNRLASLSIFWMDMKPSCDWFWLNWRRLASLSIFGMEVKTSCNGNKFYSLALKWSYFCMLWSTPCNNRGWESTIPRQSAQKKPKRLGSPCHSSRCARTDHSFPTGSCFGIWKMMNSPYSQDSSFVSLSLWWSFSEGKASRFSAVWPLQHNGRRRFGAIY